MTQDQIQLPEPDGQNDDGLDFYSAITVRRLIAEAVEKEREACAEVCDSMPYRAASAGKAAQVIRARAAAAIGEAMP